MSKPKVKLKPLYIVYDESSGYEGFFDADEQFIEGWHDNDANWRGEYFDSLLHHLGYDVFHPWKSKPSLNKRLVKKLLAHYEYESDEDE